MFTEKRQKKTNHGFLWTRDLKIGWFVENEQRDNNTLELKDSSCSENDNIMEWNSELGFREIKFGI